MTIRREYIAPEMENVIMEAMMNRKDGESFEDCKARLKKWDKAKTENKWTMQNRITNQSLTCALRIAEITLRDVFEKLGKDCPYPNEYAEELVKHCEGLSEKRKRAILKICFDLSVDWWKEEKISIGAPRQKLGETIGRRMERGAMANRDGRLPSQYKMLETPNYCKTVGVSIHWLYGLNNMTFFSEDPLVDKILDAFCFIPPKDQEGVFVFIMDCKE